MAEVSLADLLVRWRGEYGLLLNEASKLLRNFDNYSRSGVAELLARRQQVIDGFQKFDNQLNAMPNLDSAGNKQLLDEFRAFQKITTAKILELDALAIALGKERIEFLHKEMGRQAKQKAVFTAYERGSWVTGRGR